MKSLLIDQLNKDLQNNEATQGLAGRASSDA
jgi:hypothetical protein